MNTSKMDISAVDDYNYWINFFMNRNEDIQYEREFSDEEIIENIKNGCSPLNAGIEILNYDQLHILILDSDNNLLMNVIGSANQFSKLSSLCWLIETLRSDLLRRGMTLAPWTPPKNSV